MEIKKVIICGLGALGLTYANKLKTVCELKILADSQRIEKYKKNPLTFNDKKQKFEYILPSNTWEADLIIISTKSSGLASAIEYIKNFVTPKTIVISLINGISSEDRISSVYPEAKIVRSYFIGHSAIRNGEIITQDGVGKIVLERNKELEKFFSQNNIDHEVSADIVHSQWVKLGVNITLNQLSAIYEMNVGDLRKQKDFSLLAENLITEVQKVAQASGVKDLKNFKNEVFSSIDLVSDSGITSMYQDIKSKRKTEVDIFAGEIIKLGEKYSISTPYNKDIYNRIKIKEESFL